MITKVDLREEVERYVDTYPGLPEHSMRTGKYYYPLRQDRSMLRSRTHLSLLLALTWTSLICTLVVLLIRWRKGLMQWRLAMQGLPALLQCARGRHLQKASKQTQFVKNSKTKTTKCPVRLHFICIFLIYFTFLICWIAVEWCADVEIVPSVSDTEDEESRPLVIAQAASAPSKEEHEHESLV